MRIAPALLLLAAPLLAQSQTPFSLTSISRTFDASGRLLSESRFLNAVNRDGTFVSMDLDAAARQVRQILIPNRGAILVDPGARAASMTRYDWSPAAASCDERFSRMSGASVSVDKAFGDVQGVPAEHVVVELPAERMEVWLAPSLACHMLRSVTYRNGAALETLAVENLHIGDPDPRLFEVPADYRWIP